MLGKIQSGKSTLIQHILKYANPEHTIDLSLLGDGTLSKTDSPCTYTAWSSLPLYEAFNKQSGIAINLEDMCKHGAYEDYQDLLYAHEDNVGLRLAHQDTNSSLLSTMEFKCMDMPGICNHENKDSDHAASIVNGIFATHSFNLVLIVVNPHDPLTADQELALQYYSEVLQDVRSNIAIVYTHVDPANHTHSSTHHYLGLEEKTSCLNRIFWEYFEPFPCFTIDLTQSKRPIIQCMILKTIRDILSLATKNPAVNLDASDGNIKRITNLTHLTHLSDFYRGQYRIHTLGEKQPPSDGPILPSTILSDSTPEDINILILGDALSGKSSLIKMMTLLADPRSIIHKEHTMRGDLGAVDETITETTFLTDLPSIEICRLLKKNGDYTIINAEDEARTLNQDDLDALLNLAPPSIMINAVHPSVSRKYRFSIFEVPGVQDLKNLQDRLEATFKVITDSNKDLHRIIVTLAPGSITSTIRTTLSILNNRFPNISHFISFVHTKIGHRNLHAGNKQFWDAIKNKEGQLQRLTLSTPAIFMIDCNLQTDQPVPHAISQNAASRILQSVVKDKPEYSVLTLGKPRFSVLVLGRTQSGKSSLIQHIKQYTDPAYTIDQSLLGYGNISKTESTECFMVESDLPYYEVIRTDTGSVVNLDDLVTRCEHMDDYLDALHERKGLKLRIVPQPLSRPPSPLVEFRFLDTPGFNDTMHRDGILSSEIISQVLATQSFNLILVTLSKEPPLSPEYQCALTYYAKVLHDFQANVAFLYTHVEYKECHPSNTKHHLDMATKHRAISSLFRNSQHQPNQHLTDISLEAEEVHLHQYFTIDMIMHKRPIIQCLIRNTLRDILQLAVSNPPVVLDLSKSNIDRIRAIVNPDVANRAFREQYKSHFEQQVPRDNGASSTMVHHGFPRAQLSQLMGGQMAVVDVPLDDAFMQESDGESSIAESDYSEEDSQDDQSDDHISDVEDEY